MNELFRAWTNLTAAVSDAMWENTNKIYNAQMAFATEVSKLNPYNIGNTTSKKS
jgi:cobalamin biosynthesis Mg chelatase CobN